MSKIFSMRAPKLHELVFASLLAALSSSVAHAEFARPATDGPVPDSVKAACTAEKSATIKAVQERGELNWALGIAAPFGFRQSSGEYGGIEVDNASEFAHFLGVKANITDYDYGLLPPALASGKADIIGAQLYVTDERKKVIDFSDAYFSAGQVFYVLKGSKWQTVTDLNSPDNRFVNELGAGQVELAKKLIPLAPQQLVPKRGQMLVGYDFMKGGQADSTMLDAFLFGALKAQYPDLEVIGNNGRSAEPPVSTEAMIEPFDVAFGVRKDDPGFKDCVDAYVADLLSSGRLLQRIDYWAETFGISQMK